MARSTGFRFRRGQAFAYDALIAAIVAVFMLYVGLSAFSSIGQRSAALVSKAGTEARAISFADYLMKEGLAHKGGSAFGETSFSHLLELGKLGEADETGFVVSLGGNCAPVRGMFCVCRPCVIYETGEVGYLGVCAQ